MSYTSVEHPTSAVAATWSADPYTLTEPAPQRGNRLAEVCSPQDRHRHIAEAAYFLAQKRGFAPGHELDDWLAAEREFNGLWGLLEPHPNWDPAG